MDLLIHNVSLRGNKVKKQEIRTVFQDELGLKVIRLIEENPTLTQREIASDLNVSLGGVNYCLKALIAKGLIKIENFINSDRKKGYAYYLTTDGVKEKANITARFLRRKLIEYEKLKSEIETLKKDLQNS